MRRLRENPAAASNCGRGVAFATQTNAPVAARIWAAK
jgi:hypothetical protein